MRRWIEGLESFAMDVIMDRRAGRRAGALRGNVVDTANFGPAIQDVHGFNLPF